MAAVGIKKRTKAQPEGILPTPKKPSLHDQAPLINRNALEDLKFGELIGCWVSSSMEDTRSRWQRAYLEAMDYDIWGQVEEAIEGWQRLQVASAAVRVCQQMKEP
eukprot:976535-Pelagomonas_calceolata.AAC.4